jgi:hypothetical protein
MLPPSAAALARACHPPPGAAFCKAPQQVASWWDAPALAAPRAAGQAAATDLSEQREMAELAGLGPQTLGGLEERADEAVEQVTIVPAGHKEAPWRSISIHVYCRAIGISAIYIPPSLQVHTSFVNIHSRDGSQESSTSS